MLQKWSTQDYLECVGKLQDHYDALEDIKNDFLTQDPIAAHNEVLQDQLEAAQVCQLLQSCFFFSRILLTLLIYQLDLSSFISIHHHVPVCTTSNPKHLCLQSWEAQLAAFPGILTQDLEVAEQLLQSANELIPTQVQHDLATVFVDLQTAFTDVCHLSSERLNSVLQAIDAAKVSI